MKRLALIFSLLMASQTFADTFCTTEVKASGARQYFWTQKVSADCSKLIASERFQKYFKDSGYEVLKEYAHSCSLVSADGESVMSCDSINMPEIVQRYNEDPALQANEKLTRMMEVQMNRIPTSQFR